jgi:hypothetical protein
LLERSWGNNLPARAGLWSTNHTGSKYPVIKLPAPGLNRIQVTFKSEIVMMSGKPAWPRTTVLTFLNGIRYVSTIGGQIPITFKLFDLELCHIKSITLFIKLSLSVRLKPYLHL